MAVTFPYVRAAVWSDGSTTDTAAKRNTIEDGIFNAHQQPAVRVFHNANQTITNATDTALAFNSERFDTAGGAASTQHDTVTNNSRLTCRFAGKYLITADVEWGANANGIRAASLRLNAATIIAKTQILGAGASVRVVCNVSTVYDLAVNDFVEVVVFHDNGGSGTVAVTANYSPEFMWVRVA